MNYQCENTYYLNEHLFEQDLLEKKYLQSLPERYDEIISYSIEILEGYADEDTYHQVFGDYWEEERGDYNAYITTTVEEWLDGDTEDWSYEDWDIMKSLVNKTLLVAAENLFGESLYSVACDGDWNLNGMCNEVLGV